MTDQVVTSIFGMEPNIEDADDDRRFRWLRHRFIATTTTVAGVIFRSFVVYAGFGLLNGAELVGVDNDFSYWQALGGVAAFRALTSGVARVAGKGYDPA